MQTIVKLTGFDARIIADAMKEAEFEVLVMVDSTTETAPAFKIKIDGGIWSPPMGEAYKR